MNIEDEVPHICDICGAYNGYGFQPCPYSEEFGDIEMCNCCDKCRYQCALDI